MTEEDVWSADLVDLGEVSLLNIVTVIPGRSDEAIILVAHRDNAGTDPGRETTPPARRRSSSLLADSLRRERCPGRFRTARSFSSRPMRAPTAAPARSASRGRRRSRRKRWPRHRARRCRSRGRPRIALAGDDSSSPARTLVRTASARVGRDRASAGVPSLPTQLVDLGMPFAAGEQGPFLAEGSLRCRSRRRDPATILRSRGDRRGALSERRLGQLGRATEALVASIDASVGRAFPTRTASFSKIARRAAGPPADAVRRRNRAVCARRARSACAGPAAAPFRFGRRSRALRPGSSSGSAPALLVGSVRSPASCPTGAALPLPPYSSFVADPHLQGLPCWRCLRPRLARRVAGGSLPRTSLRPEERLAGYTTALAMLASWRSSSRSSSRLRCSSCSRRSILALAAAPGSALAARRDLPRGASSVPALGLSCWRRARPRPGGRRALVARPRHRRLRLPLLGTSLRSRGDGRRAVRRTRVRPLRAVRRAARAAPSWTRSHSVAQATHCATARRSGNARAAGCDFARAARHMHERVGGRRAHDHVRLLSSDRLKHGPSLVAFPASADELVTVRVPADRMSRATGLYRGPVRGALKRPQRRAHEQSAPTSEDTGFPGSPKTSV